MPAKAAPRKVAAKKSAKKLPPPQKLTPTQRAAAIEGVPPAKAHKIAASEPVSPKIKPGKTKNPLAPERIRAILSPEAKTLAEGLRALRARLGLPNGLRAEGVTEADIPKLAAKAFEDPCHRSNPRPVTESDLAKLYEASL